MGCRDYLCGNGAVEEPDVCDGNSLPTTGENGCGDGFLCSAETCDDGDLDDCDGCHHDCVLETGCGIGFVARSSGGCRRQSTAPQRP